MKNYLMSAAVGDIAGSSYEGRTHRTKDYNSIKLFSSRAHFTDDTVLTFACAESFLKGIDMAQNLWKCGNEHPNVGYGSAFKLWLSSHNPKPYNSFGNGAAMRCSSAGWLARSKDECRTMATQTAIPTHNHTEGIKGAIATALAIYNLKNGADKEFIQREILASFYPEWAGQSYDDIQPGFTFNSTCPGTVGPAIICFLGSSDYVDCIKKAIALGGDADTLAAIAGPMAYAYYKTMPDSLVYAALKKLPEWMVEVNNAFDNKINSLSENI